MVRRMIRRSVVSATISPYDLSTSEDETKTGNQKPRYVEYRRDERRIRAHKSIINY